jgi:hypothetical protein
VCRLGRDRSRHVSLSRAFAYPLPRLERTFKPLSLAISLRVLDFDFDALLLIMLQCPLVKQPTWDWSRPVSKGQFPFPLAPEFWGSWNNSCLETSSFAYGADIERGSSSFKPL